MTAIPSFGASLLQNPAVNQAPSQSVEEILQNTPSAPAIPDTFENSSGGYESAPAKGGINWFKIGSILVGATGLFVGGRKGWLGKTVQTWFGGRPSLSKVHKNIETKITEYLGRDGGKIQTARIVKNGDGNKVLRAEFEGGTIREFSVTEGKNVIKLAEKSPVGGQEEVILFNRFDGSPRLRTTLVKDKNGKVVEYASFKGGDILDNTFNETEQIFKHYSITAPKRRYLFGLFGPKQTKTTVSTFINPESGKPVVSTSKTVFKHGKKVKVIQNINGEERKILINDAGKVAQIQTKKNGKVVCQHFEYTTTPDGKQVISGVKYKDLKGNDLIPTA